MIKCAVIGASIEAIPMIELAHKNGIFVIGLDGNSDAEGLKFVDKKIVIDLKDKESVVKVLKNENIKFVLPVPVGSILTTTGYVNEKLNLPGIDYQTAILCTDKYEFHEVLYKNGLRNINSQLITQNFNFDKLNYPQIIKPRHGAGSNNVKVIYSAKEAKGFIDSLNRKSNFIIEELFVGEEYGVDGAVINNNVYLTLLRKKQITQPPYKQALSYDTVERTNKLYFIVKEHLMKVFNKIKLNDSLFNADILVNGKAVFVIELSGRPSGHSINKNLLPMATGINIVQEFINYCLGYSYNFVTEKVNILGEGFFSFEDVVIKKLPDLTSLNKFSWLKYYECNISVGEYMNKITDGKSIMNRGYFIISGKNSVELADRKLKIFRLFEFEEKSIK